MTTQQLVDDLEKRRLEASRLLDASLAVTAPGAPGTVNPIVAEALASAPSSPSANPFLEVAKSVTPGVNIPVSPSDTAPVPGAPKPVAPVPSAEAPATASTSFYDMLLQNDSYRLANKKAFERNEKANRARTTIAAVTDALASLGNLVGTTQGAFSQPQTYQTPFVTEQVEADRKEARKLAQAIQDNDQSLRLAKAKMDYEEGLYGNRLALEQAKTDRALALALERAKLAEQNAGYKSDLEGEKHGYRTEEETQKQAGREVIQTMRNQQSDINNRRSTGTSAANNIRTNDRIRETGGSGGVGGYTTTTEAEYDELGHKVRETKTRTGAGGQTTTTTRTPGGKKPNPMGSASQQGGKKKKKNPMN